MSQQESTLNVLLFSKTKHVWIVVYIKHDHNLWQETVGLYNVEIGAIQSKKKKKGINRNPSFIICLSNKRVYLQGHAPQYKKI